MKKLKPDCQKEVHVEKFFLSSYQVIPRSRKTLIDKTYRLAYNVNQSWMRYGHNTRLSCCCFPKIKRSIGFERDNPMVMIGELNFWRLKSFSLPVSAFRINNLNRQREKMIVKKSATPIIRNQKSATLLFDWGCQILPIQGNNSHSTKVFSRCDIPGRSTFA